MAAAMLVGRLGPLAAALGVGAAILAGGTGIAAAQPTGPDTRSSATHSVDGGPAKPAARSRPGRNPASSAIASRSARHAGRPAAAVATVPVRASAVGLSGFFNNQTPRLSPTQTAQSPAGVVTGQLNAVDPDSPRLSYTIAADPARGIATVGVDGSWSYTPDSAVAAGGTDSFRVTVSDAPSGFAIHGVAGLINLLSFGLLGSRGDSSTSTVAVTVAPFTPANRAPVVGTPVVGTPDSVTGVVSGSVSATDADGDTLTYSAPSTTGKGGVSIVAGTGAFTYTPTVAARNNAAATGATAADLQDSFTVTVSRRIWRHRNFCRHGCGQSGRRLGLPARGVPRGGRLRRVRHRRARRQRRLCHQSQCQRPRLAAVGHRPTRCALHPVQGQRSDRHPDPSDQR